MPSSYTAPIVDGEDVTFEQFMLLCARGMGALIMMRDEPLDAPIPDEFEPHTSYYDESEAKARATLKFLDSASLVELAHGAEAYNAERVAYRDEYLAKARLAEERIDVMLAKVEAWEPPTDEHVNFKSFVVDQLTETRRHDGVGGYVPDATPLSVDEWVEHERSTAEGNITYATKHRRDEIARTAERNAWVRALRESLT